MSAAGSLSRVDEYVPRSPAVNYDRLEATLSKRWRAAYAPRQPALARLIPTQRHLRTRVASSASGNGLDTNATSRKICHFRARAGGSALSSLLPAEIHQKIGKGCRLDCLMTVGPPGF